MDRWINGWTDRRTDGMKWQYPGQLMEKYWLPVRSSGSRTADRHNPILKYANTPDHWTSQIENSVSTIHRIEKGTQKWVKFRKSNIIRISENENFANTDRLIIHISSHFWDETKQKRLPEFSYSRKLANNVLEEHSRWLAIVYNILLKDRVHILQLEAQCDRIGYN